MPVPLVLAPDPLVPDVAESSVAADGEALALEASRVDNTTTSTRRFAARPASVVLGATGSVSA
jgi:hypothetical protein